MRIKFFKYRSLLIKLKDQSADVLIFFREKKERKRERDSSE